MSNAKRTLRTAGLPDAHPRHAAQLPPERAAQVPWLLLPAGVAGRAPMLIAPFPRTATDLSEAQADAVAAMRRKLAAVPMPRSLAFIDAVTGRASLLYGVEPPWLARQLHDRHAIPLVPFGLAR